MPAPSPAPSPALPARHLLLLALAAAGLAAAACARSGEAPAPPHATADDSVRIGVALNPGRPGMESIHQGVELAVAHLNAERGGARPLAVRRLGPERTSAVEIAAALRDDPTVVGVVGHPESGTTLEALRVYEDVEQDGRRAVVAVSPTATSPDLTGRSPWLFRVCPTDLAASRAVAAYVRDSLGARRAAVVYRNDSYGRDWTAAFAEAFERGGGTLVQRDPYLPGLTEWAAYARYMAQAGAEVLLFPGNADDAAHALRALRAEGADLAFVGGDAASALEEHGDEFAGAHYTAFFDPRHATAPVARAFLAAFEARFGRVPDQRAALAYDAAMLIGRAAVRQGPDRRRVRDALAAIDSANAVEGVAGRIAFDAGHDVVGRAVVVATVGGAR